MSQWWWWTWVLENLPATTTTTAQVGSGVSKVVIPVFAFAILLVVIAVVYRVIKASLKVVAEITAVTFLVCTVSVVFAWITRRYPDIEQCAFKALDTLAAPFLPLR
jgi:hypothetical protein